MKFALFLLLLLLGSRALRADQYSCVVDLYLAQHDPEDLAVDVKGSVFDFISRQLMGYEEHDVSRFDRIKYEVNGIPPRFEPARVGSGVGFYYFPGHYSVSQYFDAFEPIKKMVLTFQKIVAGPGSYVKADSAESASWNRTTYRDLTGVFLHTANSQFSAEFIRRYGEPIFVELAPETETIALEPGLHLIPGAPAQLIVPVKARALTLEEREHLIATSPFQAINVRPSQAVRPGLR